MRIAYIAPYQGRELMKRRPTLKNLALAGNLKIELISELLRRYDHQVEIISQGEVVEQALRFYPAFTESKPFQPEISISYSSAVPVRFLNGAWSARQTLQLFKARHKQNPFDVVIVYNLKHPQVVCADYAIHRLGLPVIFEYEDDAFVSRGGVNEAGLVTRLRLRAAKRVMERCSACLGVSPHLLSKMT
jgi:hypothetical protein